MMMYAEAMEEYLAPRIAAATDAVAEAERAYKEANAIYRAVKKEVKEVTDALYAEWKKHDDAQKPVTDAMVRGWFAVEEGRMTKAESEALDAEEERVGRITHTYWNRYLRAKYGEYPDSTLAGRYGQASHDLEMAKRQRRNAKRKLKKLQEPLQGKKR